MEHVVRDPVSPSLVLGAAAFDSSLYLARSDDRLGSMTESYRRVSEDSLIYVYDRQQSINGRFNNLYFNSLFNVQLSFSHTCNVNANLNLS